MPTYDGIECDIVPIHNQSHKRATSIGRMYVNSVNGYNVKSRRKQPKYDIDNDKRRKDGLKPKPIPPESKCSHCPRAWTVLPYFDQWDNDVNIPLSEAPLDTNGYRDTRRLQLCESCFAVLEERRKANR